MNAHPTLRLHDGYDDTSPELHDAVVELQQALTAKGFAVEPDGLFGPGTEQTVEAFQGQAGLVVDGVVGPHTWATLLGTLILWPTTLPIDSDRMLAQLDLANHYTNGGAGLLSGSGIGSAVLGGIGSRESGWGLALRPLGPTGTGDFIKRHFPTAHRDGPLPPDGGGFGRGLIQIDYDAHEFARTGRWTDAGENVAFGATVLVGGYTALGQETGLRGLALVRAAVAAYNCGSGNVMRAIKAGQDVDYFTTGRNYSADVLNRAGWFQAHGWAGPDFDQLIA